MFTIKDITDIIERIAPLEIAAEYDNVGMKLGDIYKEVTGVMVTVDTVSDVISESVKNNCNLIIEHHPSIWKPLKVIDVNIPLNNVLIKCIKNDIALYSAHTNIDFAKNGLNDYVAKKIGLSSIYNLSNIDSARVGFIEETTLKEYARTLAEIFYDDNIVTVGRLNKIIKKVAIINGAGGNEADLWQTYKAGCDVIITSEVKYSVTRLAKELDYAIIQIGHYESEVFFMQLIKSLIKSELPSIPVYTADFVGSTYNKRGEIWN